MAWNEMTDGALTLTPLSTPEAWAAFHEALSKDVKLFDVGCGFAAPISWESLLEYVEKGILFAWTIACPSQPAWTGYGIYSAYTGTHDVAVYGPGGRWDGGLVTAGLELLVAEVFTQLESCERVFTYLPVPFPPDSEELLFDMGFDPWKNDRERGLKRTYAVERSTWVTYHGG